MIGVGFVGHNYYENRIDKVQVDLRKERIKNDTLQILADGQARKLIADTLTIKQLESKVDSLKIELKGRPILVGEVEIQPRDTVKIIDTVYIKDDTLSVVDYYPNSEEYFVEYKNTINLLTGKGNSTWTFKEIKLDLVVSENKDGTYETNMKAPDFVKINSLDVQSLPLDPSNQRDDFGILLGGGYGKDFGTGTNYLEVGGGIRYKKFYIDIEGNTNKQADIGVKFEF